MFFLSEYLSSVKMGYRVGRTEGHVAVSSQTVAAYFELCKFIKAPAIFTHQSKVKL